MKKIFFLIFTLLFIGASFGQSNKWSSVSYTYSKGPVSPEYQYNYNILINETGSGKLTYSKSSVTKEYDFTVGKKGFKKLNKALKNSKVFTVSADEMKSDRSLIGGPKDNLTITMWQSPMLDARPTVIEVPSQVSELYSEKINKLYETIDSLVPSYIWDLAKSQ